MSIPEHEHEQRETLHIDVFYPDHAPRAESPLFRKTRHQMIDVEDLPCWVCGSKEGRQLHHQTVEWAYADAIDWSEGGNIRRDFPDYDWKGFAHPVDFVDHRVNMRVLCQKHHTGTDHGIHALPYPLFQVQRYVRADFTLTPDQIPAAPAPVPGQSASGA